jgi:hypothetical protein
MGFMGFFLKQWNLKFIKKIQFLFFYFFEFTMIKIFPAYIWFSNITRSMVGDFD